MHDTLFSGGRDVAILELSRPYYFQSPFPGAEFAAMIVARDPTITPAEQAALSSELVTQGCRYAVCTGLACSSWDDSVDWALLAAWDFSPPDDAFVMTSWHEDELPEQVAPFFLQATSFDHFTPVHFVVLLVGPGPPERSLRSALLAALPPVGTA